MDDTQVYEHAFHVASKPGNQADGYHRFRIKESKAFEFSKQGNIEKAALLFEEIGHHSARDVFERFVTPAHYLRAALCWLAILPPKEVRVKIQSYHQADTLREMVFLNNIICAAETRNREAFAKTISKYDKEETLSNKDCFILLRIKQRFM